MKRDALVLHQAGHISADGPFGSFDLVLDGSGAGWLLLGPAPDGETTQPVVARSPDLEFGLRLLASTAGLGAKFELGLPCGGRLLRPGRVPVEEVLAALGYAPVATVTAYVLMLVGAGTPASDVREALAARLSGRPVRIAEVEPMDEDVDEGAWCCSLTLSHAGVFRASDADGIAVGLLSGCGLDLIGRGELDLGPAARRPNAAQVIRFVPHTVAA